MVRVSRQTFLGVAAGAALFARGEGMWHTPEGIDFACTNGGPHELGQIFRHRPGTGADGGTLELFLQPSDSALVENADNLCAAPWGDLVVCEDRGAGPCRLVGVTPAGAVYTLARHSDSTGFAGVCFNPDGRTLFVNLQARGLTVAVTGPWQTA